MLHWLNRTVAEARFRPDQSTLAGGDFGGLYSVIEAFRSLKAKPDRTERDITSTLEACQDQLDWLAILAAGSKPLRAPSDDPERYTQGGVASAATLRQICLEIDSRQLADLIHICERVIRRAPWYPHSLNRAVDDG